MRTLLTMSVLLMAAAPVAAQTYTTENALVWSAPANAMDVADAQQAVYRLYVDGKPASDIAGHLCGPPEPGDTVATCATPLTPELVAIVNKRKVSLTLSVRDPEPGSPEVGPGPALVIKRPFVIVASSGPRLVAVRDGDVQ